MSDLYILREDRMAVIEPDLMAWAGWFEEARNRVVQQEQIGPYFVSTVFLGLDHNFARLLNSELPPLLFETMVFLRIGDEDKIRVQERCSTWDQAVAQHEAVAGQFRLAVSS